MERQRRRWTSSRNELRRSIFPRLSLLPQLKPLPPTRLGESITIWPLLLDAQLTSSLLFLSVVLESPSLPHSVPSSLPSSAAPSALPVPVTESSSSVPPYPLSFTALAALIATGAPIPGIREIEDRFADGMETVSLLVGTTRKPWEVVADSAELSSGNAAAEVEEKGIEAQ